MLAVVDSPTEIRCPHCGWKHGEAHPGSTAVIRMRCQNRLCRRFFTIRLISPNVPNH
jgi:hypothetical protein